MSTRDAITHVEQQLLDDLRKVRMRLRGDGLQGEQLTLGQRVADGVASTMGSWKFIIIQSAILVSWISICWPGSSTGIRTRSSF
jgi:uncharacterized membrane protein